MAGASPCEIASYCPHRAAEGAPEQELVWQDKRFVRVQLRSFLHVPLNLSAKVARARALIEAAGAEPARPILLGDERSPWAADIYLEATKDVPGAELVRLSGRFLTRVFFGPEREVLDWMEAVRRRAALCGARVERVFRGYTTCTECPSGYLANCAVLYVKLG